MRLVLIQICLTLFAASFLSGCNTVQGFGKDMQQGGQEIQKTADEHR